jgi:predicted DNA-binding protein with PD1-like motif
VTSYRQERPLGIGDPLKYRRSKEFIVIRLDEDDRMVESLEQVCLREKVTSGAILSAVGALKSGTLIFRRGCQVDFQEHLEIIGGGNISSVAGRPKVHLHIAGGNDRGTKAGHLVEGVVTVFAEVLIQVLEGLGLKRKRDNNLLKQKVLNPYVLEP